MSYYPLHDFKQGNDPRYGDSCLVCGRLRKWHWHHAPAPAIEKEETVPYIPQARRALITPTTPNGGINMAMTAGELTYQITTLLERYRYDHHDSFATFADIVAACEQAKDEFRRRVIHPFEDDKAKQNGDCYA